MSTVPSNSRGSLRHWSIWANMHALRNYLSRYRSRNSALIIENPTSWNNFQASWEAESIAISTLVRAKSSAATYKMIRLCTLCAP